MYEPDDLLEMQYEEAQAPTLEDEPCEDYDDGPDCDEQCHQGSHTETCQRYEWLTGGS